jgi:hypothetical protein
MKQLDLIAVPILVDGTKLITHFNTIDIPLKRYFILDNSMGKDPTVQDAIDHIIKNKPDHINEIAVCKAYQNTGFSGAVNWIVRQNTDCKHWIITGFDWWVVSGQWQRVLNQVDLLPFGAMLGEGNDEMCGIVLNSMLLNRVGYFDENFFPGYFEDNDYRYRIKLTNTKITSIPLLAEHQTSSTLNSSDKFKQKNNVSFQENYNYYISKWGGPPNHEIYITPFNKNLPVDYWHYNPERSQSLRWI